MVRTTVFVVVSLLAALAAAAAEPKNDAALFVSDVGDSVNGFGVELSHMLGPQFSVQLAVASERHHSYAYIFGPLGQTLEVQNTYDRTYPIDLAFRYHWLNDTRWKPYLGVGARHVGAPKADSDFTYNGRSTHAEIVGGVEFLVRPSWGVVLDGRQLLGNSATYDPSSKASLGVDWRF